MLRLATDGIALVAEMLDAREIRTNTVSFTDLVWRRSYAGSSCLDSVVNSCPQFCDARGLNPRRFFQSITAHCEVDKCCDLEGRLGASMVGRIEIGSDKGKPKEEGKLDKPEKPFLFFVFFLSSGCFIFSFLFVFFSFLFFSFLFFSFLFFSFLFFSFLFFSFLFFSFLFFSFFSFLFFSFLFFSFSFLFFSSFSFFSFFSSFLFSVLHFFLFFSFSVFFSSFSFFQFFHFSVSIL